MILLRLEKSVKYINIILKREKRSFSFSGIEEHIEVKLLLMLFLFFSWFGGYKTCLINVHVYFSNLIHTYIYRERDTHTHTQQCEEKLYCTGINGGKSKLEPGSSLFLSSFGRCLSTFNVNVSTFMLIINYTCICIPQLN